MLPWGDKVRHYLVEVDMPSKSFEGTEEEYRYMRMLKVWIPNIADTGNFLQIKQMCVILRGRLSASMQELHRQACLSWPPVWPHHRWHKSVNWKPAFAFKDNKDKDNLKYLKNCISKMMVGLELESDVVLSNINFLHLAAGRQSQKLKISKFLIFIEHITSQNPIHIPRQPIWVTSRPSHPPEFLGICPLPLPLLPSSALSPSHL